MPPSTPKPIIAFVHRLAAMVALRAEAAMRSACMLLRSKAWPKACTALTITLPAKAVRRAPAEDTSTPILAAALRAPRPISRKGLTGLTNFEIESYRPVKEFLRRCAAASSVSAISSKAASMVPADSLMLSMLTANLSASSPFRGIRARKASALPNKRPYISCSSCPVRAA